MNLIPSLPGLYLRLKHLLVPNREIEVNAPQMSGWFKIEAVNSQTGQKRLLADWFPNLITEGGLERLGTASIILACQVGSGNAAPTVNDNQLQARVAGTTTIQAFGFSAQPTAPYYGVITNTYRFAAGAAAGNLAEVGVGWTTTATLFSRALILDGGGNPTTITVLSNEFLDVSYELRLYPPLTDSNFQLVISGVTYTCVMRASKVTSSEEWSRWSAGIIGGNAQAFNFVAYNAAIGAITSGPSGTSGSCSSFSLASYSANSKQRDITINFDLNAGNVAGGIASVQFGSGCRDLLGCYQVSFSPAIPKDNTKTLSLTYRVQWSRRP